MQYNYYANVSEAVIFSISNYTGSFHMKLAYFGLQKFILLLDVGICFWIIRSQAKKTFHER